MAKTNTTPAAVDAIVTAAAETAVKEVISSNDENAPEAAPEAAPEVISSGDPVAPQAVEVAITEARAAEAAAGSNITATVATPEPMTPEAARARLADPASNLSYGEILGLEAIAAQA